MNKIIIAVAALALVVGGCEAKITFSSNPEASPTPVQRYYNPTIPHQNPKWEGEDPRTLSKKPELAPTEPEKGDETHSMINKEGVPSYEFPSHPVEEPHVVSEPHVYVAPHVFIAPHVAR